MLFHIPCYAVDTKPWTASLHSNMLSCYACVKLTPYVKLPRAVTCQSADNLFC